MATLKDAVYGLAVGDALGVPFEFKARGTFRATGMVGFGTHRQQPGTGSDDTSMTLAPVYSIKRAGGIDLDDMMDCFQSWLHEGDFTVEGKVFDVGGTTSTAISHRKGEDGQWSNGNGSLMRIVPLAFLPDVSRGQVESVSALTHAHEISKEACVIFVGAARGLLAGKTVMEAVGEGFSLSKNPVFGRLPSIDQVSARDIKSSGYVVDTLEAAVWAAATTKSYEECVLRAVNLGEDTDTVGAVAGALAGILYGWEGIPKKWIAGLRNRPLIDSCLF